MRRSLRSRKPVDYTKKQDFSEDYSSEGSSELSDFDPSELEEVLDELEMIDLSARPGEEEVWDAPDTAYQLRILHIAQNEVLEDLLAEHNDLKEEISEFQEAIKKFQEANNKYEELRKRDLELGNLIKGVVLDEMDENQERLTVGVKLEKIAEKYPKKNLTEKQEEELERANQQVYDDAIEKQPEFAAWLEEQKGMDAAKKEQKAKTSENGQLTKDMEFKGLFLEKMLRKRGIELRQLIDDKVRGLTKAPVQDAQQDAPAGLFTECNEIIDQELYKLLEKFISNDKQLESLEELMEEMKDKWNLADFLLEKKMCNFKEGYEDIAELSGHALELLRVFGLYFLISKNKKGDEVPGKGHLWPKVKVVVNKEGDELPDFSKHNMYLNTILRGVKKGDDDATIFAALDKDKGKRVRVVKEKKPLTCDEWNLSTPPCVNDFYAFQPPVFGEECCYPIETLEKWMQMYEQYEDLSAEIEREKKGSAKRKELQKERRVIKKLLTTGKTKAMLDSEFKAVAKEKKAWLKLEQCGVVEDDEGCPTTHPNLYHAKGYRGVCCYALEQTAFEALLDQLDAAVAERKKHNKKSPEWKEANKKVTTLRKKIKAASELEAPPGKTVLSIAKDTENVEFTLTKKEKEEEARAAIEAADELKPRLKALKNKFFYPLNDVDTLIRVLEANGLQVFFRKPKSVAEAEEEEEEEEVADSPSKGKEEMAESSSEHEEDEEEDEEEDSEEEDSEEEGAQDYFRVADLTSPPKEESSEDVPLGEVKKQWCDKYEEKYKTAIEQKKISTTQKSHAEASLRARVAMRKGREFKCDWSKEEGEPVAEVKVSSKRREKKSWFCTWTKSPLDDKKCEYATQAEIDKKQVDGEISGYTCCMQDRQKCESLCGIKMPPSLLSPSPPKEKEVDCRKVLNEHLQTVVEKENLKIGGDITIEKLLNKYMDHMRRHFDKEPNSPCGGQHVKDIAEIVLKVAIAKNKI